MKTKMRKLIAERSHNYGTRQLKAGDEYEANDMHARILVGIRKARYALEKVVPVTRAAVTAAKAESAAIDSALQEQDGELDRLRVEAKELGVEVDQRWGVNRLNREIVQAKRR